MSKPHLFVWIVYVVTVVFSAGVARSQTPGSGQAYPVKPVRILTSEAGGGTDFVSRLMAQGLTGGLGQQVIVENRGVLIAIESMVKAPPDGYTLLVSSGISWLMPLMQNVSYEPIRDFSPITQMTKSPSILVVHPSLPVKSVKDLIALAKTKPGQLDYSSASSGGTAHLATELFKSMAGVNIVRIPYKGGGPALNGLLKGEVHMTFGTPGSMAPHKNSGKLRVLAVTGTEPYALFPGVPTVADTLPGYESFEMYAIFAPARTPEVIVKRLNQESVRFLNLAETKDKLLVIGLGVVTSTPEQLGATVKSDVSRMGKVIRDAGIRVE